MALSTAYESKCALTGCGVVDVLEAAHIHRYIRGETNAVSNSLLLRADVHTLFDLKLVGADVSTMRICITPKLAGSEYGELAGTSFATPVGNGFAVNRRQL